MVNDPKENGAGNWVGFFLLLDKCCTPHHGISFNSFFLQFVYCAGISHSTAISRKISLLRNKNIYDASYFFSEFSYFFI